MTTRKPNVIPFRATGFAAATAKRGERSPSSQAFIRDLRDARRAKRMIGGSTGIEPASSNQNDSLASATPCLGDMAGRCPTAADRLEYSRIAALTLWLASTLARVRAWWRDPVKPSTNPF